MDDMQSVGIGTSQPSHHLLKLVHHHIIVENLIGDGSIGRSYLLTTTLVATTIDGIEQTLGQIGTSTEELHLLTYLHGRHTAGYTIVIAVIGTHEVIVLILDG